MTLLDILRHLLLPHNEPKIMVPTQNALPVIPDGQLAINVVFRYNGQLTRGAFHNLGNGQFGFWHKSLVNPDRTTELVSCWQYTDVFDRLTGG